MRPRRTGPESSPRAADLFHFFGGGMINILGICGSQVQDSNTEHILKEALKAVEQDGHSREHQNISTAGEMWV